MIRKMQPLAPLALVGALVISFSAVAQESPAIPLYPKGSVQPLPVPEELSAPIAGSRWVHNVSEPTLTPYLPAPGKSNGTAVIVAPGGGFRMLSWENEGQLVAKRLADAGVTAFLLKYRLDETPAGDDAFRAYLVKMFAEVTSRDASNNPTAKFSRPVSRGETLAAEDGAAAVRLVRTRAQQWGIAPDRIGFIGFSAGAITTTNVAAAPVADRPDFIGVIYGVSRHEAKSDSPPAFLAVAADDPAVPAAASIEMFRSWRAAKRPVEMHVYERGGHGFGMTPNQSTTDLWFDQFIAWMRARGLMKR